MIDNGVLALLILVVGFVAVLAILARGMTRL